MTRRLAAEISLQRQQSDPVIYSLTLSVALLGRLELY